mgnify:CR=1 FL=1
MNSFIIEHVYHCLGSFIKLSNNDKTGERELQAAAGEGEEAGARGEAGGRVPPLLWSTQ